MAICATVMIAKGVQISTARFLEADNGSAMMIAYNSPTVMSNKTDRNIFKKLNTGDKILVIHGPTAESYPGQTKVYAVFRLQKGSFSDIPQAVFDSLIELGWLHKNPLDDFSFELTWNCYGVSSYDSATGKLIKTTDSTHPDDYITYYHLTDEQKLNLLRLIEDLDVNSYPDEYNPNEGQASSPSMTLILTVRTGNTVKTIKAENIALSYTSQSKKGQAFLDVCKEIKDLLMSTEEWAALPDYEFLYD
jgi:hypothetical protein